MAAAHIFPGQGSQSVGMGRLLAAASPDAAAVWQQADDALGEPISRLAWEGPAAELDLTMNAQPALLAASVAATRALEAGAAETGSTIARARFYAGHSMGQYSAMVAAGVLDFAVAVGLVRERGRLMQASSGDGAMAAIIGLPDERIEGVVAAGTCEGVLSVANRNSPGQIVISGQRAAVEAASAAARELGARKVMALPVSVAAHSPLMAKAAEGMRRALAGVPFRAPAGMLIANADAAPLADGEDCRRELVEHLTRGVDWVAAVRHMADGGVDTFIEVGPGRVLCGLVRRIVPEARTIAIDDITAEGGLELPVEIAIQE